jgi:hypothetical protein
MKGATMEATLRSLQDAAQGVHKRRQELDAALVAIDEAVQNISGGEYILNINAGTVEAAYSVEPASPPSPTPAATAPPEPSPTPVAAPEPPSPVEPSGSNGHDAEADEEVRRDARGRKIVTPPWYERGPIIESEQRKKKIVDYLIEKSPAKVYASEIAEKLNVARRDQVADDLRQLIERGSNIVMIPNHGRPPGVTSGRFSNAYYATDKTKYVDPDGGDRDPLAVTVPQ